MAFSVESFELSDMKLTLGLIGWLVVVGTTKGAVKKVDCHSDEQVCQNPICKLTPHNRNLKIGEYGCTPTYPARKLWIRITQFKKTSANVFMPGNFDITQDACEMLNRKSPAYQFIKTLVCQVEPGAFEDYDKSLRPCPIKDAWKVTLTHDVEPRKDRLATPDEFKAVVRVYNELNQTFYAANVYYVTRRGF